MLHPIFVRHNRPAELVIQATIVPLSTTFTLVDNAYSRHTLNTVDIIAVVEPSIVADPNEAICHCAQQLVLYSSTFWKILQKDLGSRAYKTELMQDL